jgi:hypothetical protein
MLAVFTKPLDLVARADIAELPAQTWPEGDEVEFKGALPHKSGGIHPWLNGQATIGDYARDEILAEVVAFANYRGGSVVLGITETADNPPRAHQVVPLPRVGELARRFEDQARSCIEPPLPRLQIRAIETDGQGGGVVVFRTSPSRAAPHRLTTTRDCYIRRGSSTVKMTMREIQDMTLNVARGLAGIDAAFKARRETYREWAGSQGHAVTYRVTALPLVELPDPGRIVGNNDVFPLPRGFQATTGDTTVDLPPKVVGDCAERPRLRGVARTGQHSSGTFVWELYQTGLTDLWISTGPWSFPGTGPSSLILYHAEMLAAVANTLTVLDHFRGYVGAPDAEYGMEIEIGPFDGSGEPLWYYGFFGDSATDRYQFQNLSLLLPHLAVRSRSEFQTLLSMIDIDVYDGLSIRRQRTASLPLKVII